MRVRLAIGLTRVSCKYVFWVHFGSITSLREPRHTAITFHQIHVNSLSSILMNIKKVSGSGIDYFSVLYSTFPLDKKAAIAGTAYWRSI